MRLTAALLTSTAGFLYSVGGEDAFAIGGASPELVAAFTLQSDGTTAGEYFRKASSETTFSGLFTHSVSGLLTMFDSTGTLVWAPHNLTTDNSEDLTSWTNIVSRWSVTANQDTYGGRNLSKLETSSTDGHVINTPISFIQGQKWSVRVVVKNIDIDYITLSTSGLDVLNPIARFNIASGSVVNSSWDSAGITDLGGGYYLLEVSYTATPDGTGSLNIYSASASSNTLPASAGLSLYVGCVHVYRSDLGGMADNPDQTVSGLEKYVPTTSAAVYLPRRNAYYYNGSSWVKGGVRFESAAATNLLTHSEDFTNAVWLTGGLNSAISASATAAPTGDAYKLADDNAGGTSLIGGAVVVTVATTTTYTFSVHCKADGLSWVSLQSISLTTPANGGVWFDLSTGTIGTENAGFTGHIEDVGGGWYRCAITFTTDAADTSGQLRIYLADTNADTAVDRDNTSSILVAGAQFEAGSVPSSYIPTSGSTATRAAETLSIAAADLPYSATGMFGYFKGLSAFLDNNGTSARFMDWSADANNYLFFHINSAAGGTGSGAIYVRKSGGGAPLAVGVVSGYTPGVLVPINSAFRITGSVIQVADEGTAGSEVALEEAPTGIPVLSATNMNVGSPFNGFVSEIRLASFAPSEADIEEVTTP